MGARKRPISTPSHRIAFQPDPPDCGGICEQEQLLSSALVDQGEPVLARVNRGVFSVNNTNNQNPDQKQDQQREKPQDQQQNQTQKPEQPKQPSEKPDPVGG